VYTGFPLPYQQILDRDVSKRPVDVPQRVTPRNHDNLVRGVTVCGQASSS